jgi:2'-5' RNA ligase
LFVALHLPESVRREVEAWQRDTLTDPALRPQPGGDLRIVLLFLGNRPVLDVGRYLRVIRVLCATSPAPLIELGSIVPVPIDRGRPRLFVLPAKSPEAEVLQVNLRSAFRHQRLVFFERPGRGFWPHVTVARVRIEAGASRRSRRPQIVHDVPNDPLPASLREPFKGASVGLYASDLYGTGAKYELLGRADLPGAAFTKPTGIGAE